MGQRCIASLGSTVCPVIHGNFDKVGRDKTGDGETPCACAVTISLAAVLPLEYPASNRHVSRLTAAGWHFGSGSTHCFRWRTNGAGRSNVGYHDIADIVESAVYYWLLVIRAHLAGLCTGLLRTYWHQAILVGIETIHITALTLRLVRTAQSQPRVRTGTQPIHSFPQAPISHCALQMSISTRQPSDRSSRCCFYPSTLTLHDMLPHSMILFYYSVTELRIQKSERERADISGSQTTQSRKVLHFLALIITRAIA